MKPSNTQSPPPPDTNSYQMPAELAATLHPVAEAEQRAGQVVARVMAGVSTMLAEHMRGVKLELRAITNDNSKLRQNLSLLNEAMGEFQIKQVIPLRDAVQTLTQEQTSVVVENGRKLELLIQALTRTITAAGGLVPADLKAQILDGRFENLDHEIANDAVSDVPGYVPVTMVQAMIDAAVDRALAKRGTP